MMVQKVTEDQEVSVWHLKVISKKSKSKKKIKKKIIPF